jgi:tRNA pseudouridine55 synthase
VFRIRCGKGTYVRTLVDDLARRLGGRAHLTALRRLAIGSLTVEDAHTISGIEAAVAAGSAGHIVVEPAEALRDLPEIRVASDRAGRVVHGRPLELTGAEAAAGAAGHPVRVTDADGKLLAVYRFDDHIGVPEVVLG